jgi:hypothetical protein
LASRRGSFGRFCSAKEAPKLRRDRNSYGCGIISVYKKGSSMRKILGPLILSIIFLAGPVLAQPYIYGLQDLTTIEGKVERIQYFPTIGPGGIPGGGTSLGVVLKTDQGSITIHLGPPWYLSRQKFSINAGDNLRVIGSRAPLSSAAIIAREVTKNGMILKLRDEQGVPVWHDMGTGGE